MKLTLARLLHLVEAGRRNSAADARLIQAIHDGSRTLGADCAAAESAALSDDEATALLEAEFSANQKSDLIRTAIKAQAGERTWTWVRDLFDSFVVYEHEPDGGTGSLFKRTYVIAEDGTVTLGEPTKVIAQTVYTPAEAAAREAGTTDIAGDVVPLVEKAVRTDGTVPIKAIAPGWGSSGYYPAEVLERDGPAIFKAGTHMFIDHPSASEEADRPERSVRELGGVFESDARWEADGPDGPGLYADIRPLGEFAAHLDSLAPHIGVSIRAMGRAAAGEAEGRKGPVIESLVAAKSVDFVTRAGAGGKVLSLLEAARTPAPAAPAPPAVLQEDAVSAEQIQKLQEALAAEKTAREAAEAQNARRGEALVAIQAQAVVEGRLRLVEGIQDATRARLLETLVRNPPTKDGVLDAEALATRIDEAVKVEAAYLASLGFTPGRIVGMNSDPKPAALDEATKARATGAWSELGLSENAVTALVG